MQLTGTVLKRRYCILEKIGQGGQGSLYLARDMDLGVNRAVKKLPASKKKEAKLMRVLSHPCLPQMIDYIEKDDFCYLIMEYIDGLDLRYILDQRRYFDVDFLERFFRCAYEILDYLHNQMPPLVHGDVKPSNFMVTEQGFIYLVDFGSASIAYDHQRNCITGTVKYASEKQRRGIAAVENDIYSLGKTIYELMGIRKIRICINNPRLAFTAWHCIHRDTLTQKDLEFLDGTHTIKSSKKNKVLTTIGALLLLIIGVGFYTLKTSSQLPFIQKLEKITEIYHNQCDLSDESQIISEDSANYDYLESSEYTVKGSLQSKKTGESETEVKCSIISSYFYPKYGMEGEWENIDTELKRMLHDDHTEMEQIRILILLAYHRELLGEKENAEVYYKQLLRDYPKYEDAYIEYGLFLLRMEDVQESKKIYTLYQKQKTDMNFKEAENKSGNLLAWEKWLQNEEK